MFAPNAADSGEPGNRRPGLAILSRNGFVGTPEIIQDLEHPLTIPFAPLRGDEDEDTGFFRIKRLSRPILTARVPVGDHHITVFNCHLKSKLGELIVPDGAVLTLTSIFGSGCVKIHTGGHGCKFRLACCKQPRKPV